MLLEISEAPVQYIADIKQNRQVFVCTGQAIKSSVTKNILHKKNLAVHLQTGKEYTEPIMEKNCKLPLQDSVSST